MNEIERVREWMNENEITMKSLSLQMGISYLSVYTIIVQRKNLTSNFKWRFAQVFGWEVATELFDQPAAEPEAQPEPATA